MVCCKFMFCDSFIMWGMGRFFYLCLLCECGLSHETNVSVRCELIFIAKFSWCFSCLVALIVRDELISVVVLIDCVIFRIASHIAIVIIVVVILINIVIIIITVLSIIVCVVFICLEVVGLLDCFPVVLPLL